VVADALRKDDFDVAIETVRYEFQRGGNRMMRIVTRRAAPADRGRTDGA
jgi:hypothetical protein